VGAEGVSLSEPYFSDARVRLEMAPAFPIFPELPKAELDVLSRAAKRGGKVTAFAAVCTRVVAAPAPWLVGDGPGSVDTRFGEGLVPISSQGLRYPVGPIRLSSGDLDGYQGKKKKEHRDVCAKRPIVMSRMLCCDGIVFRIVAAWRVATYIGKSKPGISCPKFTGDAR